MTQRIDVSNLAGTIDGGTVNFSLSAWLGGYATQGDSATVIAHFLNAANGEIGSTQLPAVTAADRGSITQLLFRQQPGVVPVLTRAIELELTAIGITGENDGYADNISLVLSAFGGFGDLNLDGVISTLDWQLFRGGQLTNMTGYTATQALAAGDLNSDFRNDHADFVLFKSAFDAVNGAGAFLTMLASVPEPGSGVLAMLGLGAFVGRAGRRNRRGR